MTHVCWCEGLVLFEERCDDFNELLEVLTIDEMASMLEAHDLFVEPLSWLLSQRHGRARRREVFAVQQQDSGTGRHRKGLSRMDIQDLMLKIVERMQTTGQQRPAIYAETPQGVESYQIFQPGGKGVSEDLLFFAGRTAGLKHRDSELIEATFVAEVWRANRDALHLGERPTDSPARVEGVVFLTAKGKLTGLKLTYENRNVEKRQTLAFIAGWRSRTMSDEEVKRLQPQGIQLFLT